MLGAWILLEPPLAGALQGIGAGAKPATRLHRTGQEQESRKASTLE